MNNEPARVVGFISESAPWGERESPIEHVARTAADAVDDLEIAIFTAKTQRDLVLLKDLSEALVERLKKAWKTAHTLDTEFVEMRGRS